MSTTTIVWIVIAVVYAVFGAGLAMAWAERRKRR